MNGLPNPLQGFNARNNANANFNKTNIKSNGFTQSGLRVDKVFCIIICLTILGGGWNLRLGL